ncbi:MAG: efflux RND transporter periplasmic adaptor subunit [Alphaproteobacteria bacterium]|nr:efflux RND transporter periplasmic adaptor subunit [Alphaproteobacteria bacterium]
MKQSILKIIGILLLIALAVYFIFYYSAKFGANKAVQAMRAQATTPFVRVGTPTVRNMDSNTRFIALVNPLNAVDVKTQVAGTVQEVSFTDGQFVREGDTLFTIESDRYKANVSAAKANLSKAEADLKQVKSDYARQKQLHRTKDISTADLEKSESRMAQAEAAVEQAKATLELAEIDLKHTNITAPIDGRIGQVLITKGNYVDLASPALARIVQTTPVKITFSLSDKEHLAMRKMLKAKGTPNDHPDLQLELSDKSVLPLSTDRIFLDNEMDRATATISLYAEYDNVDELLVPNNHVTVLWKSNEEKPALFVPQTAIYNDANGSYVMLAKPDDTAVQQYVKTGRTLENAVEIESGLTTKDLIVLSGGQKLHNGQSIHIIQTEDK